MELTKWEVKGMNCVSCSNTVSNLLKSKGMVNIHVDFSTDDVSFENVKQVDPEDLVRDIENLGFRVILPDDPQKKNLMLSFL